MTGEVHDCIENPPVIPDMFDDVWQWFLSLNGQRQELRSLSWSDIKAYFTLMGDKPSQWDLELIQQLDNQYLNIMLADASEALMQSLSESL